MIGFIEEQRKEYGVEPICRVLPIAPSTYHEHVSRQRDPEKMLERAKGDEALKIELKRVFDSNFGVYGARKVWWQLLREGFQIARCAVERLMRQMGLKGAIRGRPVRTTTSDQEAPCPLDHVKRQFHSPAPNRLWLSDFTYVATWSGFVYVAFIIDAYARRVVGWRVSRTAHIGFVLHALDQALHERRPMQGNGLVHHSDRGSQYVSIKYTERLKDAGIEPSVCNVGDSYDNALAETVNGLYKAKPIPDADLGRSFEAVEFATLEWVAWFNNRRLMGPIGNIPPVKLRTVTTPRWTAPLRLRNSNQTASGLPGAAQARWLRKMRSGSQSYLVDGYDGRLYVVQYLNTAQGRSVLIRAWTPTSGLGA